MSASALLGLSLVTALAPTVALVIRAYRSASRYRVAVSWWGNDPDMPSPADPSQPPAPRLEFELRETGSARDGRAGDLDLPRRRWE